MRIQDQPSSLLFLTIPAAITAYASYKAESAINRIILIKLSLSLAALGFFTTLMTIIGRFYPFPANVRLLATPESLMGTVNIALLFMLKINLNELSKIPLEWTAQALGPDWLFFLVFSLYTGVWATVTQEIMALFNT